MTDIANYLEGKFPGLKVTDRGRNGNVHSVRCFYNGDDFFVSSQGNTCPFDTEAWRVGAVEQLEKRLGIGATTT